MDQDALRLIIRRKLTQDELPHDGIPRFWGGPANGEECHACEEIISSAQFVMEGISSINNQGLQLHVECFYVWDMERDVPGRNKLRSGHPAPDSTTLNGVTADG